MSAAPLGLEPTPAYPDYHQALRRFILIHLSDPSRFNARLAPLAHRLFLDPLLKGEPTAAEELFLGACASPEPQWLSSAAIAELAWQARALNRSGYGALRPGCALAELLFFQSAPSPGSRLAEITGSATQFMLIRPSSLAQAPLFSKADLTQGASEPEKAATTALIRSMMERQALESALDGSGLASPGRLDACL